jgi:Holliday junction resolvase RusA-like endonuclease
MRRKTRIKQKIVLNLMKKNGGVVIDACKRAKVAPTQFYVWIEKYPSFRHDVENIYKAVIGICNVELYKMAMQGDLAALSRLKGIAEWKLRRMKKDE